MGNHCCSGEPEVAGKSTEIDFGENPNAANNADSGKTGGLAGGLNKADLVHVTKTLEDGSVYKGYTTDGTLRHGTVP